MKTHVDFIYFFRYAKKKELFLFFGKFNYLSTRRGERKTKSEPLYTHNVNKRQAGKPVKQFFVLRILHIHLQIPINRKIVETKNKVTKTIGHVDYS